jgi:asparagine synthase (glutamine-hydrolysing)
MCGINGVIGKEKNKDVSGILQRMNDSIAHRGPDAAGIWQNDICGLGHRRLSIIDTSPAGNQPFFSSDHKITMVFNGEIYNYIELKKELEKDFTFQTQTDTEVIIAAYRKWGIDCISHFFGMFAFALWDDETNQLFIVRDRLGIKPLYYGEKNGAIWFSSEIRALLNTNEFERKISTNSLADYFRYQTVHAPNTIIAGIHMLMPGHYMLVKEGKKEIKKFWSFDGNVKASNATSITEVRNDIKDIMHSSIELRMRADVPFGAFLSGGIDSSIIVGLMSEISTHPVNTFSITFHEKEFDESPYSDVIAKKFKTDHTKIQLKATDFLDLVPDALLAMDHPSGDGPNTYVVSKVTRDKGVKMALSGLGGDEVFAGYEIFKRMKSLESRNWINKVPRIVRESASRMMFGLKPSVATEKLVGLLAQPRLDFAHVYPLNRQVLSESIISGLMYHYDDNTSYYVENISAEIQEMDLPTLSKVSIAEMSTYMQNTLLRDADQMSMAHALEVRVPFLDHRLIEYVLGVSDDIKFPHTPKSLLTTSFEGMLPHDVIHRPKMGFTFPWAIWMKNELRAFCEENLRALGKVEIIRAAAIEQVWQRFLQNDPLITWSRIWPLVVLGHWVKQHDVH